jgi:glycosyltransferase involved in cell wall biosynthesis
MMNPFISLIIPMYNASKSIEATLLSIDKTVLKSFVSMQVIVVDDGSNDDSSSVVASFKPESSMTIEYHFKENGGISSARNMGLSHAKGEWIMFCDADDTLHESVILHHLPTLLEYRVDVVKFSVNLNQDSRYVHHNEILTHESLKKHYIKYRHEGVLTFVWSTFIQHQLIKKHKIRFDERIKVGAEDNAFLMDIMSVSKTWQLSSFVGINYTQTPGSIMNAFRAQRYHAINYMFEHELLLMDNIDVDLNIIHHRVWWFVRTIYKQIFHKKQNLKYQEKCQRFEEVMDYHGISMDMIDALFIKYAVRRPHKIIEWMCILRCLNLRRSA